MFLCDSRLKRGLSADVAWLCCILAQGIDKQVPERYSRDTGISHDSFTDSTIAVVEFLFIGSYFPLLSRCILPYGVIFITLHPSTLERQ